MSETTATRASIRGKLDLTRRSRDELRLKVDSQRGELEALCKRLIHDPEFTIETAAERSLLTAATLLSVVESIIRRTEQTLGDRTPSALN